MEILLEPSLTNEIIFDAVIVTGEMLRLFSLTIYHTISDTEGKSIKKMTGREPVCSLRGCTFLPDAIFKQLRSLNVTASCRENAYVYLTTHGERKMHGYRETEEGIESTGGEVGEEEEE